MPLTLPAAAEPEVGGAAGLLVTLMERLGAPGAGLAAAAENIFPPLPSELFLPLAGFTASRGEFTLVEAVVWTTLGSVCGALVLYYLGRAIGRDRVRSAVDRMPLMKVADFDRTEAWFARHGTKAVLLGRMVPLFRSLISVPAGVERMPPATFVLLTTVGSAAWNTALVVSGYQLGEHWYRIEEYVAVVENAVIAVLLLAVVSFIWVRVRRGRRTAAPADPARDPGAAPGPGHDDAPAT